MSKSKKKETGKFWVVDEFGDHWGPYTSEKVAIKEAGKCLNITYDEVYYVVKAISAVTLNHETKVTKL